jgi:hypothetical protein
MENEISPVCAKTDREMQNTNREEEKQFPGSKRQGKRKLLVGFVLSCRFFHFTVGLPPTRKTTPSGF